MLPFASASACLLTSYYSLQVRAHFRPEFVNRIDEFTVFKALQRQDIKRIVKLQAKRVEERLNAKKMKMQLKEPAIEFLAVCCCSPFVCCWLARLFATLVVFGALSAPAFAKVHSRKYLGARMLAS